ncbi:melanocortin-2 receptor accessory protein [Odocoileus virginianus]|uniref:Melanocortin-2 receptor accessory protein n=1 Tax=Odocoileus virginianus TaxID=9874 RepID=A0ABM4H6R9_ODOVR
MANRTNTSAPYYSYEYYLDYLDLMPVDEKKLRANKHSIVIAFWVSLAAFVVFLFLILLYMSWSGSPQTRNATQRPPTCSWSLGLSLLCVWRQPQHARAPPGDPAASPSLVGEPESGASWPVQRLQWESPSTSAPPGPPCSPLGTGPRGGPTGHQLTSATRPVSLACRQSLSVGEPTPQTHVPSRSLFT